MSLSIGYREFKGWSLYFLVLGVFTVFAGNPLLGLGGIYWAIYCSKESPKSKHDVPAILVSILLMVVTLNHGYVDLKKVYEEPIWIQKTSKTVDVKVVFEKSEMKDNPYVNAYLLEEKEGGSEGIPAFTQMEMEREAVFDPFFFVWVPDEDHFFALYHHLKYNDHLLYIKDGDRYIYLYTPGGLPSLKDNDLSHGPKTYNFTGVVYKKKDSGLALSIAEWLFENTDLRK